MTLNDVSDQEMPSLAPRKADGHKGTYGRVMIVGGSRGKAGAPGLAGMAALRGGAGLVTVVVPRSVQVTVAGFEPSLMTVGLGDATCDFLRQEFAAEIFELAANQTCLALGPGMGTEPTTQRLVHTLYHKLSQPMVVDADALNALSEWKEGLKHPGGSCILTPHPGEFQRLTGEKCAEDLNARAEQAAKLANENTIVVLKGHRTIVTDGTRVSFNQTGNPGMATGGSGDSLTGIIAALLAQGMEPWDAARLGVHVHGLAGDLAAEELGEVSLIASDLVDFLPLAFLRMADSRHRDDAG
ncbi:MAG: NAD(P)H-hydrate dehydratase [Bythopirellula sp.]|nr:NAD(P)H-hydrate dehydratase [Bythopirellula sp.]